MSNSPACLVCHGDQLTLWAKATDIEYYTSRESFGYFHCEACDLLVIHPVPSDRLAEIYPHNYYSFVGTKQTFAQKCKDFLDTRLFAKIVREIPGKTLEVLDIGGGSGYVLNQVKKADKRVSGTTVVDIDPAARDAALRDGHRFFLGRFEEFPSDGQFDLILMLNIIEHVDQPGEMLRKVRALLKPGGRALIKTPNFDSLDARLFRHRSWGGYHCPRHWVLFNRASLASLIKQSGLNLIRVNYTQGAPFWATSILGELNKRSLVQTSSTRPVFAHPLAPLLQAMFAIFDIVRSPISKTSQMFVLIGRDK